MPFRFPSWSWTLIPLIRRVNASSEGADDKPSSSKAITNDPNETVPPPDAHLPLLPGFPPQREPTAPEPSREVSRLLRDYMSAVVDARRQRRPFRDELERLNQDYAIVDYNNLPVMSRDQYQEWMDNQDQLVFSTLLRNQQMHLMTGFTLSAQLIETERLLHNACRHAVRAYDKVDRLKEKLKSERASWKAQKVAIKNHVATVKEEERKKNLELEAKLLSMAHLKYDLEKCVDELTELKNELEEKNKGSEKKTNSTQTDSNGQSHLQPTRVTKRPGDDMNEDKPETKSPRLNRKF